MKPNLSSIIGSFTKTVEKLDKLVRLNGEAVIENDTKISTLTQENTELNTESQRAKSIGTKIKELIA